MPHSLCYIAVCKGAWDPDQRMSVDRADTTCGYCYDGTGVIERQGDSSRQLNVILPVQPEAPNICIVTKVNQLS